MKQKNYKVEYIQEFAKELTFSKDFTRLSDQLLVLAEQHHRMKRLQGQVDYIIHDSPFALGMAYVDNDEYMPKNLFCEFVSTLYNNYNNLNVLIKRNPELEYQEYGRNQNINEAINKDNEIKKLLSDNNIPFVELQSGVNLVDDIIEIIEKLKSH